MQTKLEGNSGLPEWQSSLINSLFNTIKSNYIFHEKIDETAFKKMLVEAFAKINLEFPAADKQKFCSEVNNILKEIDPHLILQYDIEGIADDKAHSRIVPDPRENGCAIFVDDGRDAPPSWYEKFARENYGFQQKPEGTSSSIPEAIEYVKINDFLDPRNGLGRLAQEEAHRILEGMQGSEAVIIDLRDSHGGSPEMVEYIISHLLTDSDKSKIKDGTYNSIYDHLTNVTTEYKVRPTEFNLDVPVYVLTNKDTFSAAEEFAYDLAQINAHVLKDSRFTVVGQTTKGGAHAMAGCPLMDSTTGAINDEFFLWVPNRTTINPYTHTNWEDGPKMAGELPGVRPNIAIEDGQDALEVALRIDSMRSRATLIPAETIDPGQTLQFKERLREMVPMAPTLTADIGDADLAEDKSSITPLLTTPKPPGTA